VVHSKRLSGHLFIVQGDLLGVACDAILIPSGTTDGPGGLRYGHVLEQWQAEVSAEVDGAFLRDAPDAGSPVVKIRDGEGLQRPAVWAGLTGGRGDEDLAFYTRAVDGFIREAGAHARDTASSGSRPLMSARPLLALPLIGGGEGGRRGDRGELLAGLVTAIVDAVDRYDVDVALVLYDSTAYAAAEQARWSLDSTRHAQLWGEIDSYEEDAARLARLAREERLVVFLGAGASMGAGLPAWGELIERLARRAGLGGELEALSQLEPRDAGRILAKRLEYQGGLASAVVDETGETVASRGSLLHQLVASLPVREAVTTNYDALFEKAWAAVDKHDPRILPWEARSDGRRWLLKLHGSIDHPESIVLSRDDYLRFEAEGVPLAGIVQPMLLTRHMLFVGYSLSDDNFHRLVHQVRAVIGPGDQRLDQRFGTVLTPRPAALGDELWEDDVSFVHTTCDEGDDPRRLAILLDRVGALAAAPGAHLLIESYGALLSGAERDLAARLRAVWAVLEDGGGVREVTRHAVRDALKRIGQPDGHPGGEGDRLDGREGASERGSSPMDDQQEDNDTGIRIIRGDSPEAEALKEKSIQYLLGVISEMPEIAEGYAKSSDPRLGEAAKAALKRFREEGKWAPKPPTPWSYWVTEDKRILAGQYPGDLDKTTAAVKLTQLVCAGVTKFVDLTEPGELRPYDQLLHKHFPDIEYVRVSVKDVTAVDPVQMTTVLTEIADAPAGVVYVHCRGGCGRTGQVLGCYLIEQGYEPVEALQEVQILTRPLWGDRLEDCPQTAAQKQVVLNWRSQKDQLSYGSEPVRLEIAEARVRGCLLGGAVGDALGAGIEFDSIAQIRAKFGPAGVTGMTEAYGRLGAITDDTQMTLFTAEGLLRASSRGYGRGIYPDIASVLDHAYSRWLLTQGIRPPHWEQAWRDGHQGPDGDGWLVKVQGLHHRRAPGNTCLSALQAKVEPIGEKAHNDSKGCGGVMRVAPVGLIAPPMYLISDGDFHRSAFAIGDRIAAVTHGHPSGHLAAGVLADVIYGVVWHDLGLDEALDHGERVLANQPGHEETLNAVRAARRLAAAQGPPSPETVAQLGEGWVAEEALAIAIYCALVAEDFRHGVLLAVNHSGDSDSTGAIAGNLLGAMYGLSNIPDEWLEQLELREEIRTLADDWMRFAADPNGLAGEYSGDARWMERYPGW
jgi:ADP-ribosylglycohydrolase